MSKTTFAYPRAILSRRVLVIGLIIILGITVIAVITGVQTDQVLAPPGLRIKDWLRTWMLFNFPDPV